MQDSTPNNSPFIPVSEAVRLTGCPRSTILKYSKTGQFPRTVSLLGQRIGFVREDVRAWIDSRLMQSTGRA